MEAASDSLSLSQIAVENCRIALVRTRDVRPHEIAVDNHQEDLSTCVLADRQIKNPIIVTLINGTCVLCDGTHRVAVARNLGLAYLPAQVLDLHDPHAVRIGTWGHAMSIDAADLLPKLRMAGFAVERQPFGEAEAAVALGGELGWIATRPANGHAYVVRRRDYRQRDLRAIVDAYVQTGVERVPIDGMPIDLGRLFAAHSEANLFMRFALVPASDVGALIGDPIPSGITRFQLIGGRAIGVNVPLELLRESTPDWLRAEWLDRLRSRPYKRHAGPVAVQESTGPRVYSEAILNFDPSLVVTPETPQH
jgi:hypothetical protein